VHVDGKAMVDLRAGAADAVEVCYSDARATALVELVYSALS
jgi:hypothetical protein